MPNITIFGCGAVGKAVLYYAPQFIGCKYNDITVIDKYKTAANFSAVQECLHQGARFLHYDINSHNITELLDKVLKLKAGDIVLDVTTRSPTMRIFAECRKRGILFVNTDINRECEGTLEHLQKPEPFASSLYMYHIALDEVDARTRHYKHASTTCVNESGMNPGLISMFVKRGLRDMARYVVANCNRGSYCKELRRLLREKDYRGIAQALDVQVIHCSEIDTQRPSATRSREIKKKNVLVNTWSVEGMVEEATEPCAVSLGTHERSVPVKGRNITMDIVPQVGILHKPGMQTLFRSYLPVDVKGCGKLVFGEIYGVSLPHGETFSLQKLLATDDYAPTMHYVYKMNPITMAQIRGKSREELTKWTWDYRDWKVLNMHDDALSGTDNVGATILLGRNPITGEEQPWGWWSGSILDTEYTTNVLKDPYFGPTVIPVMAGLLSGAAWALKNPQRGMVYPEDMDEGFIFKAVKKYLGRWYSGPITGVRIRGTRLNQLMVTRGKNRTTVPKEL